MAPMSQSTEDILPIKMESANKVFFGRVTFNQAESTPSSFASPHAVQVVNMRQSGSKRRQITPAFSVTTGSTQSC